MKFSIQACGFAGAVQKQSRSILQKPFEEVEWFKGFEPPGPLQKPVVEFSPARPTRRVCLQQGRPGLRRWPHNAKKILQRLRVSTS